jgi:hypothetical protein
MNCEKKEFLTKYVCLFFHVLLHCSFVLFFCVVGATMYWFITLLVLLLVHHDVSVTIGLWH